jgi:ribonucleotide reductase alpha subunit
MTLKIPFQNVVKRDGRIVPFDERRIVVAIGKAMKATGEGDLQKDPEKVAARAVKELIKKYPASHSPHIEEIQDVVEESLILMDFPKAAKAYILYRAERAKVREEMRRALSQEVREQIKESSKYFNNSYQEFIFYQFYARWRDDLGRRETWVETIDRYMDYMRENLAEKLSDKEYQELRETMLNRQICPSMRLLWSAGKACRQSNVTAYNCVTGNTEMLTKEFGLIPIEEAYRHRRVHVLSHDGKWHEATVDYFGEQDVTDITLVKGKRKVKISCTLDHKWFINGKEFKTTAELIVSGKKNKGDKIIPVFAPKPAVLKKDEECDKGVIHGIVYGDGTTVRRNGAKDGHLVRLCGDSRELLNYFNHYKHSYPKSYKGDCVVYLYDQWAKENNLKSLPDAASLPYMYGFIKGWLAADGSINKKGQTILASNKRGVNWLQRYAGLVGLPTGNINAFPPITNYGPRSEPLYRTYFFHGAVGKDDLLRSRHKVYYRDVTKNLRYDAWIVHSISKSLRKEKVYCATVPGTHTFVLKEGIVTGNCSYIAPRNWRDLSEIMYLSMCGAGVGFSVEPENVEKFPQIQKQNGKKAKPIVVEDSKVGWCEAFVEACTAWEKGYDVDIDYSKVRPAGARLKTMGGRASGPGPLQELMKFTRKKILARQNRRLTTIDLHDITCQIGLIVVAGGVRRSALLSLSALDDSDMRDAKKGTFWQTEGQRSMANNSAVYETKPTAEEFLNEWTALVKAKSGERGIFNRGDLGKQVPRRRWEKLKNAVQPGVNPCITGDTLVYVADGRGNVSIKQLAEERKDVPVFCYNKRGKPVVRMMRNPRLTNENQPVYKVILDDGSSLRATANHKFRLKNGEYKRVDELVSGDSLDLLTRFEASIKDIFPKANSRSQDYWWVNNGSSLNRAEHRLIAEFAYGVKLPNGIGMVVHHRNFNAQDNRPSNLEIMTREAHDRLHGDKMMADNNPMRRARQEWNKEKWLEYSQNMSLSTTGERNGRFSGITDGELKQHAILLTKQLGRRFSGKDWAEYAKQNNLPQYFSKWRQDHLGGIRGFAKWAAAELGLEYIDADPRVVKSYKKYTKQGYDCQVHNNELFIFKQCEVCGDRFITSISAREYGVCSISCGLSRKWKDIEFKVRTIEKINAAHQERKEKIRQAQAKIYSDLKFKLGREPLKLEWIEACKDNNISPEISRISSPFRNYEKLREFAGMYNHKVMSVELAGYEDVYNGTVDEFHNFFIGGFESKTKSGKRKFIYLNNLQCGEIYLQSAQFCNLTSIVVRPKDDLESLKRKIRLATLLGTYQATLTNFEYLSKEWKENCEEEQLLGVSITGYYDNVLVRNDEVLEQLRQEAIETNKKYAKRFGKNPSTAITCVKPHGNSGQLLGVGSGMHPWFAPYFIRRVRISAADPLLKLARDQGVPIKPEIGYSTSNASTMVLEFPIKAPQGAVCVKDVSALDLLQEWKRLKLHFTEHNPSATIYIADNEWIAVANFIYENWDIIGGLSFLPRSDHVYPLAPYEEITKEQYEEMKSSLPEIDFSQLVLYEKDDETVGSKELACAGGVCEVDLALEESGAPSVAPSATVVSK